VIAQRTGLIGIIGDRNLPPAGCERFAFRQKAQLTVQIPVRVEVEANLVLQSWNRCLHLAIG
jgi:hypothetical protein